MHDGWQRLRDTDSALAYLRQAVVNRSRSVLRHRAVAAKNPEKQVAPGKSRRSGSPTAASADPLGQGHDDSLRSAHVGHAPDVLVFTYAANQTVAVRGQPVDSRLKVVHHERHVAQS
jgi:hypothetical protein